MITLDFLANSGAPQCIGSPQSRTPIPGFNPQSHKHGGKAGIECAIGHTLVEFPLVIGLTVGLQTILQSVTDVIAITGGIVLLAFVAVQLLQVSRRIALDSKKLSSFWDKRPGIIVGLVFTALNSFFIL